MYKCFFAYTCMYVYVYVYTNMYVYICAYCCLCRMDILLVFLANPCYCFYFASYSCGDYSSSNSPSSASSPSSACVVYIFECIPEGVGA